MDTLRFCPSCARAMAADAPHGICPECLLKAALASGSGAKEGGRAFVPPPIEDLRGRFPQLEIIELIGRGGMGAVYKARQPALDRLIALKVLPSRSDNDTDFAARFTREARALARLNHPNIIAVYEFGQVEGLHYFIMEYVDGPNLRQIEQSGTLSPRQALQIIPQICEALQFAHDEGIVHRDIKPENVLIDKKGRVRIADFGLAKILDCDPKDLRLTGVKDVMGTPHYMAPEQVEKPQEVDHRADIYSLGVVFYEMLTGELPLGKFAPPSRKAAVDSQWDEVIMRALEKDPHHRYQRASEVKTRVERITQNREHGVLIEEASQPVIPANAGALRLIAAVVLGLLVVGGLVVLRKILDPGEKNRSTPVTMEAAAPDKKSRQVPDDREEAALSNLEVQLHEALALTSKEQRRQRLELVARTISPADALAALRQARSILTDQTDWNEFQEVVIQNWWGADRTGAVAYAEASGGEDRSGAINAIVKKWAAEDLDGALSWIAKLPGESENDLYLVTALTTAAGSDSQKVFAKMKELATSRPDLLETALHNWMANSPQRAADFLSAAAPGTVSVSLYLELAFRWSMTDLNAALLWVKQLPPGMVRDNALSIVLKQWVQKDPVAAADYVKAMPVGSSREQLLQQVVFSLADSDPTRAVEFVMSLPASGSRRDLLKSAMARWARKDPASAIRYADAMPVGSTRKEVYWYIGFNWGLNDQDAAWKWALSLPVEDGDTRNGTAAAVIRGVATRSLPAAADLAAQLTGGDNSYVVRALVDDAAKVNPIWTSTWVQGLPAGEARNRATENLVKFWAERDPIAASDWLSQQPQDTGYQNAARQMIPRALKASPELAWSWALKLADPKIRDQQLQNVAKQWLGMEPETARAKIQASGLPVESVTKLLTSAK